MRLGQHDEWNLPGFESGDDFLVSFSFSWAEIFYSNSSILIDSTISVSVFCFAHDHFVFLVPPPEVFCKTCTLFKQMHLD
jgi:hypothetical protein